MDIKKQIEQISTTRIRSVAKNEAIYDNADEAQSRDGRIQRKESQGFRKIQEKVPRPR